MKCPLCQIDFDDDFEMAAHLAVDHPHELARGDAERRGLPFHVTDIAKDILLLGEKAYKEGK